VNPTMRILRFRRGARSAVGTAYTAVELSRRFGYK
jgi:hypothetical protein